MIAIEGVSRGHVEVVLFGSSGGVRFLGGVEKVLSGRFKLGVERVSSGSVDGDVDVAFFFERRGDSVLVGCLVM